MIKQGTVNYFKNLKYFFTPLGALALGVVFGLSALIPGIVSAFQQLFDSVYKTVQDGITDINENADWRALWDVAWNRVISLDWNNPFEAVKTILSSGWLNDTFHACLDVVIGNTEIYASQISEAVSVCLVQVGALFVVFILFAFLGLIGGYFLTKWLVRRNIARRTLWKYLLAAFVDAVIGAALLYLTALITSLWAPGLVISLLLTVLIFGAAQLIEAYLIHGFKVIPFSKIVNLSNIAKLFVTAIIIFVISFALIILAVLMTNTLVGLFMGIALMEIALIVISLNAEAYVKSFLPPEQI